MAGSVVRRDVPALCLRTTFFPGQGPREIKNVRGLVPGVMGRKTRKVLALDIRFILIFFHFLEKN
jgi:hypothetical protein